MLDIEARVNTLEKKLLLMSNELVIEKARTEIYREIISNNTSIVLNDGRKQSKTQNPLDSPGKQSKTQNPLDSPGKTKYKSVKNTIVLRDEQPTVIPLENVDDVDKQTTDADYKIHEIMERIKNIKNVPNKSVSDLKQARKSLFKTMNLTEYIDLCNRHVFALTEIFKEKGFGDKKIISAVKSSLTPLDSRLLRYHGYFHSHLDVDEIQSLRTGLDNWMPSTREYTVFDPDMICDNMYNYGSVLFPIQMNLSKLLFNKHELHNLIYLPVETSTTDDPFSFYYLSNINKDNRQWKMDCRLEDLTNSITNNMIPYMIDNFRKMYYDVFGDNDYRIDYKSRCQLTECDCEQLVKNIFTLADPKVACKLLRNLVKDNATYQPTKNDKFNIYSDDALQKKRFSADKENHIADIPKRLFDTITPDESISFSNSI
jgi:hypothetical protein